MIRSNVPIVQPNDNEGVVVEKENDEASIDSPIQETGSTEAVSVSNNVELVYAEGEAVSRPLAFYNPTPESNWTAEQFQRLDALRNEFAAALGGWNQNPYDPAYRERWLYAQPLVDEQFETIFGSEALSKQQIQAAHYSE